MILAKCCCCIPLQIGAICIATIFASINFTLATGSLYMVAVDKIPKSAIIYFDKMDARFWILAYGFYMLSLCVCDFMLLYGSVNKKPNYMGPWLVMNFILLLLTIATAMINALGVCRSGLLIYGCMVVYSFHDELLS